MEILDKTHVNQIEIFSNELFGEIRVMNKEGQPWFVGKDVAEKLGYKDTSDALKKHVDIDDKMGRQITDSVGRLQNTQVINEGGLYEVLMQRFS